MYALLQFCKKEELRDVNLHLFTDGRDAPPQNGIEVIKKIEQHLESIKVGRIASITGRYYAMDRDGRWERTQKAYEAIVSGKGLQAFSAVEAVQGAYAKGKTDEFIEPTIILDDTSASKLGPSSAKESVTVNDNDAVIFFNFRVDRPRQLTMAFVFDDFESLSMVEFGYIPHEGKMKEGKAKGPTFKRTKVPRNVYFVTMTEYQKNLPVGAIAYPPPTISNTLPEILSQRGMLQMHLAESEKERMVTFYFDGLKDERFPGEDVEIISSPDVPTYDKKPEMSVYKIVKSFKRHIKRNKYHFFMLNFANPDMVAHSGNLEATIKAVEAVDKAVGELVKTVLDVDGTVFITADHGNAEELLTFPSRSYFITTSKGSINTEHSNNPVPLLIVSNAFKGNAVTLPKGALSDIAPTILNMMGIPVPPEMDGKNLLEVQVSGKNKQASNIRKGEESSVLV
jgi:2,3-bisphosphoglycerate-independent phosphoglycerate mutase